ncbi:hypothetical protein QFC20_002828 [Naganishia adeliensis]|uniref:Uncharacterized protein n=1 Tax=Naganishia adeliensis TaxID=92952 RepID=A0ACC2WI89_9TREE|nr:hypothetical protein QFC20_002828 [Naganishia adeliensis]
MASKTISGGALMRQVQLNLGVRARQGIRCVPQGRTFAAAATATAEPAHSEPPLSRPSPPSTTPESASTYLSTLLSLPSSRPFPPQLALQILTHKSYRASHLLGYGYRSRTPDAAPEDTGSAPHNARLAFLGKRALVSYLLMFLHQQALAAPPSAAADGTIPRVATLTGLNLGEEFSREHALEEKIANLTHGTNLGREVGREWGLERVMRWQNNWTDPVAQQNGALTVQGETVNAIIGGTLMHFGSPAAHRLFHLEILPRLERQFKEPRIQEAIQAQRKVAQELLGGGVVVS